MTPSRPAQGSRLPAIDWEEAFRFYAALPPEERCYRSVADRFGVSVRTVEKRGRAGRWRDRVVGIQAEAAVQADERLARDWGERVAEIEKLVEASFGAYEQRLLSGSTRVTASDFVGLVKLLLQLRGQPTERVEVLAGSAEWIGLRTQILEAVANVPEARAALTELLERGSSDE